MVEMICKQDIEYPPGTYHKPGDKFDVEEQHVKLFTVIGRAELVKDMTAEEPEGYLTRDIQPKRKRGRPRKVA